MQNASVRLNQFLQREHTHLQTDYHESGSDHARIFTCEMRLQVYAIQKGQLKICVSNHMYKYLYINQLLTLSRFFRNIYIH